MRILFIFLMIMFYSCQKEETFSIESKNVSKISIVPFEEFDTIHITNPVDIQLLLDSCINGAVKTVLVFRPNYAIDVKVKNDVYHLLFNHTGMIINGYTYKTHHSFDAYFLKNKNHFIKQQHQ